MKKFSTVAKVVMAAAVAASAVALTAQASPMLRGDRPVFAAMQSLGLTDAQRAEIRRIAMAQRGTMKGQREEMRALVQRFVRLDPDAARYAEEVDEIAAAVSAATQARILRAAAVQREVLRVLTPEQRARLPALVRSADLERFAAQGRGRMLGMIEALDLSDEQFLALRHIRQAQRDQAPERRALLRGHVVELVSLDPEAADYDARAQALAKTFAAYAAQQAVHWAGLQREVYAVLTPEQRTALISRIENRIEDADARRLRRQG